jgi:hypothetical protein
MARNPYPEKYLISITLGEPQAHGDTAWGLSGDWGFQLRARGFVG